MRPDLAIEAILVHAEIRRRIAETNKARLDGDGARRRFSGDHKLNDPCGSRRLGLSCHVWHMFTRAGNKGGWGIALNSAELRRRLNN
jgi:hypothetical protein